MLEGCFGLRFWGIRMMVKTKHLADLGDDGNIGVHCIEKVSERSGTEGEQLTALSVIIFEAVAGQGSHGGDVAEWTRGQRA